ncbi:alpha/beta hydrolase [Kineosporia succinea]|uniref:Pimeloyl-ACP methyl ester carboxylesterase n=1 Tax=Kineosporia succinea TaxID=84632 RepID=A0ABT9PCU5_9ACTN|nr:alpha/beta hydrolase [Kineosporia succinea]MDP9830219.1 pimeloyl-ACP methyl ester carboxylesterase [Kineosporia succinea]
MRKVLLAAVCGAVAVAGVTVPAASDATTSAPGTSRALTWGTCPATTLPTPDLECTTVRVPLDYRQPSGKKITLAISRLPSTDPGRRRGVLLTNPGGPGISGLDFPQLLTLKGLPAPLPASVREQYDVIGIDPRGVGRSTPVTCDLTPEQIAIGNLPYARTPADVTAQARVAKAEAAQCADADTSWMLPHMTTANTARDLDTVRQALGESTASFLGVSYGSYLGAVYTTLFPRTTDRVVLDSVMGPEGYDITAMRGLARGMEDRFPDFAAYAAAHPEYGLGATPARVTRKYHQLADRLRRRPLGIFTESVFRGATFSKLYSTDFDNLAGIWQSLDRGVEPELPDDGADLQNTLAARFAVICGESDWPRSVARYQLDVAVDRVRYPKLGAASANISACAFWHEPSAGPKVAITGHGPSNVLLVQNERDPGTPLVNARRLRVAFGVRARMVTIDQGGHGVYGFGANRCGSDAMNTYLATGERPRQDVFCARETR